jgi:alpha-1,3-fucosyltransferase
MTMKRRQFQVFFYKLNRRRVLYPLWLFFLFNVFTLKQLTISETENDTKEFDVVVENVEQSSALHEPAEEQVKTILMWNPWYGDFGFTLDDDSSFR